MKNILSLLVIALISSVALAQENNKDTFYLDGDVIQATLYHDNGEVAQTGFYTKENKLHGEWVSFDRNGNKTAVAKYNNGAKTGTWYFFSNKNIQEVTYADARIAKVVTWKSENTQIVSN
ncbi:toxin-antitoxin system YwqK family antitoxin [Aequorivita echinoideorum]|uniref:Nicotinic acid mononucleotide adenyltransferase n=1 Tax=Aequorivita echinoideorum TaxID=1549647 RepID=A0ABS5S3M8_9FLAO|nr:nicotinic acid mononucleotide adenyltransferase [Aequorivita echinoideorum]MBT0607819.1 nicotinic acid mononucleotide adenyltransferase [Aequorivita echinoideorum]